MLARMSEAQTQNAGGVLLLGVDHPTTWIVYNDLVSRFGPFPVLLEQKISRWKLLKFRIAKVGLPSVISQTAFVLLIRPVLERLYARRKDQLTQQAGLESIAPISTAICHVESVNSDECRAAIMALKPKVAIVNGTRIIGRKTLAALNCTVINTHQGITPAYRGSNGAYWALHENDAQHCGVTIHLVDEGIDTGNIIAQAAITPTKDDSFVTYAYLQTAAALAPLANAVKSALSGKLETIPISGPSRVWYHPGIFQYFRGALRGVK